MYARGSFILLGTYVALVAPVEVAHVGDIDLECALYFLNREMSDMYTRPYGQKKTSTWFSERIESIE